MLNLIKIFINIFFPSRCVSCEKIISFNDNNLCRECISKISFVTEKCSICSGILKDNTCTICHDRKFYLKKNYICTEYEGVMKDILHNYKFSGYKRLHKHLASFAYDELSKNINSFDFIISVPMNKEKKWRRGYNQSELVAKRLSILNKIPYKVIIKEKKVSKTQKNLGYRDRFINVLNRYEVIKGSDFYRKNILIVDDIFTTGATLNECARILKKFGAEEIFSLTIARTELKNT